MGSKNFKETRLYKLAFELAINVFEISKPFPKEEQYSLTDQIRRSLRSVCTNLAEAYRKKQYPAHFVAKVSDSDMENSETNVWLNFSIACNYLAKEKYDAMLRRHEEIVRMLNHMMNNPDKH